MFGLHKMYAKDLLYHFVKYSPNVYCEAAGTENYLREIIITAYELVVTIRPAGNTFLLISCTVCNNLSITSSIKIKKILFCDFSIHYLQDPITINKYELKNV